MNPLGFMRNQQKSSQWEWSKPRCG